LLEGCLRAVHEVSLLSMCMNCGRASLRTRSR
jgi:hypothetical protein